jgi:hypothetical protein
MNDNKTKALAAYMAQFAKVGLKPPSNTPDPTALAKISVKDVLNHEAIWRKWNQKPLASIKRGRHV